MVDNEREGVAPWLRGIGGYRVALFLSRDEDNPPTCPGAVPGTDRSSLPDPPICVRDINYKYYPKVTHHCLSYTQFSCYMRLLYVSSPYHLVSLFVFLSYRACVCMCVCVYARVCVRGDVCACVR